MLFAHDLSGKPLRTFPDRALARDLQFAGIDGPVDLRDPLVETPQLDAMDQHERGCLTLGVLVVAADEIDAAEDLAVRVELECAIVLDGLHHRFARLWWAGALSQSVRLEVISLWLARLSSNSRSLPAGNWRALSRALLANDISRSCSDCVCFLRLRLAVIGHFRLMSKMRSSRPGREVAPGPSAAVREKSEPATSEASGARQVPAFQ
ncbi:hypothetical protein HYH08_05175 [Bradyrhizobium sp. BR 10289]|nr:hypothetical protein [Bradyrhizobium sp. BR 10289]